MEVILTSGTTEHGIRAIGDKHLMAAAAQLHGLLFIRQQEAEHHVDSKHQGMKVPHNRGLTFRGANGAYFLKKDLNTSQIQGVCLEKMCEIDVKTGDGLDPIDFQLAEAFYRACDPVVSEDDLYTQQLMHLCTFANWVDNNEPIGNTEMNGIQYAFQYSIGKSGGQYIDVESIQAFAAEQLS